MRDRTIGVAFCSVPAHPAPGRLVDSALESRHPVGPNRPSPASPATALLDAGRPGSLSRRQPASPREYVRRAASRAIVLGVGALDVVLAAQARRSPPSCRRSATSRRPAVCAASRCAFDCRPVRRLACAASGGTFGAGSLFSSVDLGSAALRFAPGRAAPAGGSRVCPSARASCRCAESALPELSSPQPASASTKAASTAARDAAHQALGSGEPARKRNQNTAATIPAGRSRRPPRRAP